MGCECCQDLTVDRCCKQDVQVEPSVKVFVGLQSVTISDFAAADRLAPQYLDKYPALVAGKNTPGSNPLANSVPVVSLNCSRAHVCQLNGLTITSATQSMGCPGCADAASRNRMASSTDRTAGSR